MKTSAVLHQFAWLFTRENESVRMQIYEHGGGFRLIVNGPGVAEASHDFESMSSLMIFLTDYQDQLRANNFRLQASAERRNGGERRPHAERDERRRRN